MKKPFQPLKRCQPTPIVSASSFESVRVVISCYENHKRPKVAVAFETSFLLAKPYGYLTFHRRHFSMGVSVMSINPGTYLTNDTDITIV